MCFRAIVWRIVQFGSLWQLGTGGGEYSSRVQSASGPIFAGRARPLEAMASTPLTGAHPLPEAIPFWVARGAGNASSLHPFKSTLEWTTVGAPSATSLRPGPPATKVGKKEVSSGRIRQAPSCWIQLRGAEPQGGRGPGPRAGSGPLAAQPILLGRRWIRRSDQQRRN